jgi:hypothetical protein
MLLPLVRLLLLRVVLLRALPPALARHVLPLTHGRLQLVLMLLMPLHGLAATWGPTPDCCQDAAGSQLSERRPNVGHRDLLLLRWQLMCQLLPAQRICRCHCLL